ncbi:MAG: LamG-like jellyroll fold domain-containing protein [Cyclobacteriaceae bacterium]|nr:LamG-like jellyroll fold domain-containing protein [Cyclobacteriaceae bacterium]
MPIDSLKKVFEERDFIRYLHKQPLGRDWPKVSDMIQNGSRVVLFTMETIFNQPDWLHPVWNFAVEPYFSLFEAPNFLGEFLKGDPKNDLLIINDFNIPSNRLSQNPVYIIEENTNHYLLNHCLAIWRNTGKTPNFIFLDQYTYRMQAIVNSLRLFKTVQGQITFNMEPLDYVNWEGRDNCMTSGDYVFPVSPGDNFTLKPNVPGFSFIPELIRINEPTYSITQNFVASPLKITDGVVAYFPFDKQGNDQSPNKNHGKGARVSFPNDKERGSIAQFDGNGYIVLPRAESLSLRDHAFTIAAWVKLAPNKNQDNSILGTTVRSYQEGIHFTIRDKKPYFGFFANDVQGNEIIEEGTWYHIVARYNKLNGEQAIFVNGKLDNRSLGHTAYQGKEEIMLGNASFGWPAFFNGQMDEVTIWDRPLGDQEIFNLAMNVISVAAGRSSFWFSNSSMLLGGVSILILAVLIWYLSRRIGREKSLKNPALRSSANSERAFVHKSGKAVDKNFIRMFGAFMVIDRNGKDITEEFTPKIKALFVYILIYSSPSKNGITTDELTETIWPEQSNQSAKNSRGVSMRKLRLILEQIDKAEIIFERNRWMLVLSAQAHCDYFECLYLLDNPQFHQGDYYKRLFELVQEGQMVKNENYAWLDDTKGYLDYRIIDSLIKYISILDTQADADLILRVIERIHISDPVNEKALELKINILLQQGNDNYARYCFDTFCKTYEEFYNQTFPKQFGELVKPQGT